MKWSQKPFDTLMGDCSFKSKQQCQKHRQLNSSAIYDKSNEKCPTLAA